jgi:hypothetical protein
VRRSEDKPGHTRAYREAAGKPDGRPEADNIEERISAHIPVAGTSEAYRQGLLPLPNRQKSGPTKQHLNKPNFFS